MLSWRRQDPRSIDGHGGLLLKHTGDGVCAAFGSARAAVDAAVAAQRGLGLPLPMSVATGEAQERDGDYFGPVLNRAAWVMSDALARCGRRGVTTDVKGHMRTWYTASSNGRSTSFRRQC
jgi:hypothetical protein